MDEAFRAAQARPKRSEADKGKLRGASRQMAEGMTEKELEDLASTRRKGLPEKKD